MSLLIKPRLLVSLGARFQTQGLLRIGVTVAAGGQQGQKPGRVTRRLEPAATGLGACRGKAKFGLLNYKILEQAVDADCLSRETP